MDHDADRNLFLLLFFVAIFRVSNTVRKNNGTLSVEVDDEWFCVDIIINNYTDSAEEDSPEPAGSGGIDETAG